MQQTARRPGRPRDPQVQARHEQIYQLITQGLCSRSELARASGHDREAVHSSCKELEKQGRIRKCWGEKSGSPVWVVDDDTPCP